MTDQDECATIADTLQGLGVEGEENAMLVSFYTVAKFDTPDQSWFVTYASSGTGSELPDWEKIALLRPALLKVEALWQAGCLADESDD